MKILFVASEGLPFSKTGGLADVIEALPKALVALGHEVVVLLPRYRMTQATGKARTALTIPMGATLRSPAIVGGEVLNGVRYYFVEDPEYFDRDHLYGTAGKDYPDNAERFVELSRGAIEFSRAVWTPDVIHCHDWQTAMIPVLLRTQYGDDAALQRIPVIFTIHNMGYQGVFPRQILGTIGAPENLFRMDALEFYGQVCFLKGGLIFGDYLTTVSPTYAREIQTEEFGGGLDGVLRGRADHLVGILNGVDYSVWNPEKDKFIAAQYSPKNLAGKIVCKQDLLSVFMLPAQGIRRPLIGIVSRFADQKGFDLIANVTPKLLAEEITLVALGAGEPKYERMFRDLANLYPGKVGVKIAYDNVLAHKIEAGADIFLMPSQYEPCGLNQIYSLKYGTVPVVRATGGLDDTIDAFKSETGEGTGFKFKVYDGDALLDALAQTLAAFRNKTVWKRLQISGMAKDFSWQSSALDYARLYEVAWKSRNRTASGTSN